MVAANYDIFVEQGATFRMTLIFGRKTGALDVDGNAIVEPYDLTGVLARLQVRQRRGSPVLISATTQNDGITLDNLTGKIMIQFHDEATDLLSMRRAKYDLELQYPSGDVVRVVQGKVTISASITTGADLINITSGDPIPYEVQEQDIQGPD